MSPTLSTTDATVSCSGSAACGTERTRFFAGQLITPDDLTQDQDYFRERMRRHNRLLHGWGIVCGAGVTTGARAGELLVGHGYVLGPYGDEIVIAEDVTIDLAKEDGGGNLLAACGPPADPWCHDVTVDRRANSTIYLAIRYAECPARPVRSTGCGCSCRGAGECEYSRTRDSFEIRALSTLPESYAKMSPPSVTKVLACPGSDGPPCPRCPTDPWVVLADITLGADGRTVASVRPSPHRRYVGSLAQFYFMCKAHS
jgi:hypothetical protein